MRDMGRCILALYRSAAQPKMTEWGAELAAAERRPGLVIIATEDHYTGGEELARRSAERFGAAGRRPARPRPLVDAAGSGRAAPPRSRGFLDGSLIAPIVPRLRRSARSPARSLGSTVKRSGRSSRSARCGGSAGRKPMARSTASGNLAGWAVASETIGPGAPSRAALPTATAECGSSSIPVAA